jgi:beta-lactamase regulating signal transducer with metallopeptidase domain
MTVANYGSVFTCCFFGSLMMLYLYLFCRSKHFVLKNGTLVIYIGIFTVVIRMLLPWNFIFASNIPSTKILPFLFDFFDLHIGNFKILTILIIVLTIGSSFHLVLYFYKLFSFKKLLYQLKPIEDARILGIFSTILNDFQCSKHISISKVSGLSSPAITGLFHPVILLPEKEYPDQELQFILMHELNHYLHYDLWKSFFCELLVCIYWWNPLAYLMRYQMKETAEYQNDISLTQNMDELEKTNYMLSLLKVSSQTHTFHILPTLHYRGGSSSSLKKRCDLIDMQTNIHKNLFSQFLHIGIILLLFIFSVCFIFQPKFPAPTHDEDGSIVFDKPTRKNTFLIKQPSTREYNLYVKQNKNLYVNVGSIQNLEDYKDLKKYNNKKEALKENDKKIQ